MSFEDFLVFSVTNKNHHWLPQSLFVPSHTTFIGKLETFDDDFDFVLKAIGKSPCAVKAVNKTQRGDYRLYYNDFTIGLISRLYADDINRFGYSY